MSDVAQTSSSAPAPAEGSRDRLSGLVAVIIAFTTLVAAVAGFLQADASQSAGDRRYEAEQLSLAALADLQTSRESAQVELQTLAQWVGQRTQAGNAYLASLFAGNEPEREQELLREQERWETIAEATLKQSALDPDSEFGPNHDPTFPQRYFASATLESTRLNALLDAANEEATNLDQQAASFTAILAILAIALYLFGLTLAVVARWLRLSFLGVGLGMLTVALLWMTQAAFASRYDTNDEAANEYAQARVASMTAVDKSGFQSSEDHYTRAIQLRPTFARAYAERASVIFEGASPQRSGFVSIAPPEALARASADLQAALALGLENAPTLGSLGFYTFAEGVQSGDLALLNESFTYTQRAIALDPTEPVYRYNQGAALAAAGRFDDARDAYQQAVLTTIYVDPAAGELRLEPFVEEQWLAGALTDLEIIRAHQSGLAQVTGRQDYDDQIRALKEQIVGRVTAQNADAPVQSPATFANINLDIFPAELQWTGDVQSFDETRDTISAQWYYNDPDGNGWAVIPEVSQTRPAQGDIPGGHLFQLTSYVANIAPPDCLPSGSYRVELYVNGRLAAEASEPVDFGGYDAFVARDLTMAFCRPSDWVRRTDGTPGIIDGYQSPDGQYGAYIARWSLPGSVRDRADIAAEIADVTATSFESWFPATPVYDEQSGTTDDYFMGLSGPAWRWYDYEGGGSVRVGAGLTSDGAVLVGMVYGPTDWFGTPDPYRIVNSFIRIE